MNAAHPTCAGSGSTGPRVSKRLLCIVLLISACGCASSAKWISVRSVPQNPLAERLNLFARGGPRPSARTMQLLRRHDLHEKIDDDPQELVNDVYDIVVAEPTPEKVYALAEVAYLGGRKVEHKDRRLALDLYGASVVHSFVYLFDPRFHQNRNPYDPQYRWACDLYNASLESALRIVHKQGVLVPGRTHTIKTATRELDVTVNLRGSNWKNNDFQKFEFVSDYELKGLSNHYLGYGLGVPMIAVCDTHEAEDPKSKYYPPQLSVPMTAFMRVVVDPASPDKKEGKLRAILELHDPLETPDIQVADRLVPLERDMTTPLAYFLNQPAFNDNDLATLGLLRPEEAESLQGLYMLEPYQPGKVPVVMVHGLWSSPLTWVEMFNDLRSDPRIREHYQFWFYQYPTGQPFWFSATQMREDMQMVRQVLDAKEQEAALDQQVLVGHSMGGLVSKLQVVSSENEFWGTVTEKPFHLVSAEPEVKNTLEKTFFFEPSPSVRRVVTIGTPHRGSNFANDFTQWFARKLIALPRRMLSGKQDLLRDNPGLFRDAALLRTQTSLDSLDPDSPFLAALYEAETAPWVKMHTIIGEISQVGLIEWFVGVGDGVVPVESAVLANASSQKIVIADHNHVHRHPRSVLEVRRILLEHLEELREGPTPYYAEKNGEAETAVK